MAPTPLLTVDHLTVEFAPEGGPTARALDGVSLTLDVGRVLAVVGESGSGKSTLGRAIIGTIAPPGRVLEGSISLDGRDLLSLGEKDGRHIRGGRIAFVPQDPLAALNPVHRVGAQVAEVIRAHRRISHRAAWTEAIARLEQVGLPQPARLARTYPHRLSGGERQRVVIAMAVALEPDIVIADEPTTALDATVQAQIIELLDQLRRDSDLAVLLVTHDLGVVASIADEVLVLYAGRVAETAPAVDIYRAPVHPYTTALLAAVPRLGDSHPVRAIAGAPPSLTDLPSGCALHPRCPSADELCARQVPPLRAVGPAHVAACHHPGPVDA
jgi:oligopeptide transport system ATP-binding protein